MTSLVLSAGIWCEGGHHDARPAFKWDLLAVTISYNHVDVLELYPVQRQPVQPLRFVAHDVTKATLHRHNTQQGIPDIAYHVSISSKVAVHAEALYRTPLGLGLSHVVCVAPAQQHCLTIRPTQIQGHSTRIIVTWSMQAFRPVLKVTMTRFLAAWWLN